jgi:hypothetical protein
VWQDPVALPKAIREVAAAFIAVLADGSARAQKLAGETMKAVKDIVGFVGS